MSLEQASAVELQLSRRGTVKCQLPKRFIVTFLCFIGLSCLTAMRLNMNIAIVAMVNLSTYSENNTLLYEECPSDNSESQDVPNSESKVETFNWDSITQSQILVAFNYGYFVTILIGGYLADRFGAHRVFGASVIATSIFTLLTPICVRWGLVPLIIVRVLIGLSEGVSPPSLASLVSKWAPKMERTRMNSFIFTGAMMSVVPSYVICGWLCSSDILGGWSSAFYVFGFFGCIWYIFWYVFVYESPFKHPFITEDEFLLYEININTSKKNLSVPWISIFRSIPFWALVIAFMGSEFTDSMTALELPTFISSALHVDIQSASLYCAIPGLTHGIGTFISSWIADALRKSEILSITNIRKIFSCIAGYSLALSLLVIPYGGCQVGLVIFIFSIGMFVNGFKYSGFHISSVDMSPPFAGIVHGIAFGISSGTSILGPSMAGILTADGATISNWAKVFNVSAVILVVTTSIFALFSSSELQPWGKPDWRTETRKNEILEEIQCSKSCVNKVN